MEFAPEPGSRVARLRNVGPEASDELLAALRGMPNPTEVASLFHFTYPLAVRMASEAPDFRHDVATVSAGYQDLADAAEKVLGFDPMKHPQPTDAFKVAPAAGFVEDAEESITTASSVSDGELKAMYAHLAAQSEQVLVAVRAEYRLEAVAGVLAQASRRVVSTLGDSAGPTPGIR